MKRALGVFYFGFFIWLASIRTAHAYIDPATTSYLIQIVAGVLIAAGATVVIFWRKIAIWFSKQKAIRARKARERAGRR